MKMRGSARVFALDCYKQFEFGWPMWHDTTQGDDTIKRVKTLIEERFLKSSQPDVALKKLEVLYQNQKDTKEYLTEFKNLKVEVGITNDYAHHILIQNAHADLIKKVIYHVKHDTLDDIYAGLRVARQADSIFRNSWQTKPY